MKQLATGGVTSVIEGNAVCEPNQNAEMVQVGVVRRKGKGADELGWTVKLNGLIRMKDPAGEFWNAAGLVLFDGLPGADELSLTSTYEASDCLRIRVVVVRMRSKE